MGISDLCRMAIVVSVIIHYKSCELILTEDFFKKVTIRCEIVVDLCLMWVFWSTMLPIKFRSPPPSIGLDGEPETIKEFAAKQH